MLCPVEESTKSILANAIATSVIDKAQGRVNKPAIEEYFQKEIHGALSSGELTLYIILCPICPVTGAGQVQEEHKRVL